MTTKTSKKPGRAQQSTKPPRKPAAKATRQPDQHQAPDGIEVGGELPAAQDAFAALVARGHTRASAFRAAFPQARAWKAATVYARASELASRGLVAARIDELQRAAARANEAGVSDVLQQYLRRLYADPRDVVEVRVSPCRYCWGKGHLWQFTDGELAHERERHADRVERAAADGRPEPRPFDEQGGGGYNAGAQPNPECPSCAGAGQPRVILHDSRNYSESALALFGGAKETKEGIEVKLASRDEALEKIARFVGFFEADNAQRGDGAKPVDTAALDAMYDRAMAQWQQEKERALGRMDRLRAAGLKIDDGDAAGPPSRPE